MPTCIRWPGVIKPNTIVNDICAHEDFLPTFAAAAGEPDVVAKARKGHKAGNKTYKVHLDGYNLIPFFKGEVKQSPRREFVYWTDEGQLCGIRLGNIKVNFLHPGAQGTATSGRESSRTSAFLRSSTCVPILSSAPTRA